MLLAWHASAVWVTADLDRSRDLAERALTAARASRDDGALGAAHTVMAMVAALAERPRRERGALPPRPRPCGAGGRPLAADADPHQPRVPARGGGQLCRVHRRDRAGAAPRRADERRRLRGARAAQPGPGPRSTSGRSTRRRRTSPRPGCAGTRSDPVTRPTPRSRSATSTGSAATGRRRSRHTAPPSPPASPKATSRVSSRRSSGSRRPSSTTTPTRRSPSPTGRPPTPRRSMSSRHISRAAGLCTAGASAPPPRRRRPPPSTSAGTRRDRRGLARSLELAVECAGHSDRPAARGGTPALARPRGPTRRGREPAHPGPAVRRRPGRARRHRRDGRPARRAASWRRPATSPPPTSTGPGSGSARSVGSASTSAALAGAPRAWQSKKARDLLKLLVAERGRAVHREALMEALWPGDPVARTANRLSVALSTLRTVLDAGDAAGPVVLADRTSVRLDLERAEVDVELFLADADAGSRVSAGDPRPSPSSAPAPSPPTSATSCPRTRTTRAWAVAGQARPHSCPSRGPWPASPRTRDDHDAAARHHAHSSRSTPTTRPPASASSGPCPAPGSTGRRGGCTASTPGGWPSSASSPPHSPRGGRPATLSPPSAPPGRWSRHKEAVMRHHRGSPAAVPAGVALVLALAGCGSSASTPASRPRASPPRRRGRGPTPRTRRAAPPRPLQPPDHGRDRLRDGAEFGAPEPTTSSAARTGPPATG